MIQLLWLLSLADALLTIVATRAGARELNPVMAASLAHGAWYFLLVKMLLTTVGCWFLYKGGERLWVKRAAIGCVCVYAAVLCLHIYVLWKLVHA
jgi:hypothetical protein